MSGNEFFIANLCINRYKYLPPEIYNIIMLYLYQYPHQYPYYERKIYNRILPCLPKLSICSSPRMIFTSCMQPFRTCKFIYALYHSKKDHDKRILVIEYVPLIINASPNNISEYDDECRLMSKRLRKQYMQKISD